MLFNSFGFIFGFLPLVLALSWLIRTPRARIVFWTLASYVFYAFAGPGFVALLFASTIVDFVIARRMAAATRDAERRALLVVSIAFGLGLLAAFKYFNFFVDTTNTVTGWLHQWFGLPAFAVSTTMHVVLPAGISFYTFMTMSYTIDVYRRELQPEASFWHFACFVALFPHLIVGPILRARDILPQIHAMGPRHQWRLQAGLFLVAAGLAKKVLIADWLAVYVDIALYDVASASATTLWLAMLGYALQLYFDFSGYSDMARGLAWLLGLDFAINFNAPFRALDPRDFWRRWHITLSTWFRDYVYVPLGGNRAGALRTDGNLMLTMILAGLWHGAGWNFVLFGVLHGTALVLHRRFESVWARLPVSMRRSAMFTFFVVSLVPFRLHVFEDVVACYRGMFSFALAGLPPLEPVTLARFLAIVVVAAILGIGSRRTSNDIRWAGLRPLSATALGLLAGLALLTLNTSRPFFYFRF